MVLCVQSAEAIAPGDLSIRPPSMQRVAGLIPPRRRRDRVGCAISRTVCVDFLLGIIRKSRKANSLWLRDSMRVLLLVLESLIRAGTCSDLNKWRQLGMDQLKLDRLERESMHALSASMIGEKGKFSG
jgi:hypothetical protein